MKSFEVVFCKSVLNYDVLPVLDSFSNDIDMEELH